ncbi:MAG: hypothetical protein JWM16_5661 [Verrucomicrobiales bacterium]|nr:hypothetical protein [Verrucomicrobiales bacterium]
MSSKQNIPQRERDGVIQPLQAGLPPCEGIHHVQVGRKWELEALVKDIGRVKEGGAACRLVAGPFGSGKSFLLHLTKTLALKEGLVVVQADITTSRRLFSSKGEARALYSELVKNAAIKSKPGGGALQTVIEKWISQIHHEVRTGGGSEDEVKLRIQQDLKSLQEHAGGYSFAQVLGKYYESYMTGNEPQMAAALRWLRAEYSTKTEAKKELGVNQIISDENFYESLKLLAAFCVKAGYKGLFVILDEMVVLSHRIANGAMRQANFDVLLTILNDCLQGNAKNLGFLFAGTDDFIQDTRRGLYSYEALRSRLAPNTFASEGLVDFSGPVIWLKPLCPEDLFVLLQRIRHVHAYGDLGKYLVPDEAIAAVLHKASQTLGAEFFKTPREVVRSFIGLLNLLEQNPGKQWQDLVAQIPILASAPTDQGDPGTTTGGTANRGLAGAANDLTTL